MKSLIAVSFLLVLVQLASSANTIYVQNYAEAGCLGGKVGQPHAVSTDTCIAIPPSSNSSFTSFSFGGTIRTQEFAKVYSGDGANCTQTAAFYVPCGQCLPTNNPGEGNYRYHCSHSGQYALAEDHCNSDCSACGVATKLVAGQCLVYGKGTQHVELDAIAFGSSVIESVWAPSTTCAGPPSTTATIDCGKCYGSSKFSCSATKGKSFMPRHAQKGGEFHHLKHLEKSL